MKFNKKEKKKEEKSDLDIMKDLLMNKKIVGIKHVFTPNEEGIQIILNDGSNIIFGSSSIDWRGGNRFFYKAETRESMIEKLESEINRKKECLSSLEKEYNLIKSQE